MQNKNSMTQFVFCCLFLSILRDISGLPTLRIIIYSEYNDYNIFMDGPLSQNLRVFYQKLEEAIPYVYSH